MANHRIRAVAIVDAHFYEIEATNPDIALWQLVKFSDDEPIQEIREWRSDHFKAMLSFLDDLYKAGTMDAHCRSNPPALFLVWNKFDLDLIAADALLKYWQETYLQFHTPSETESGEQQ